jgi:histidine ammonia-lyase
MGHLWSAIFKSPGGPVSTRQLYGIKLRYPAAAHYAELRHLAAPATLDLPSLDIGVEDHATGAPLSVSNTDRALGILEDLLIVELLLARDLLAGREEPLQLGGGTSALLGEVESVFSGLHRAPRPAEVHSALRQHLSR